MRILIVADFSSIHVYNYLINVISKIDCECIGYHIVSTPISNLFASYYIDNNIKIIEGVDPVEYQINGAYSFTKQTYKKIMTLGKFDYLHVHAVRLFVCPALFLANKNFDNIILTYWGSDLYRVSNSQLLKTIPLLYKSKKIVMMTEDMKLYFKKLPWYVSCFSNKICITDFGNMFYEKIINYSKIRKNLKEEFGLSSNKIALTIGYVGRPQMQQFEAIQSILSLISKHKDIIQIAIPAYGIDEKDFSRIDHLLKTTGIQYGIYPDFMDADRVSKFRSISDIFVHSQTTDALSSAMLEHLFAGSIVVNGAWLKYSSLDDNGIFYRQFSSFSNLPHVLEDVLENFDDEVKKCTINRENIAKISSWEYLRENWISLYK